MVEPAKNAPPKQGASVADVAASKRSMARRSAAFLITVVFVAIGYTMLAGHTPSADQAAILAPVTLVAYAFVKAILDTILDREPSAEN